MKGRASTVPREGRFRHRLEREARQALAKEPDTRSPTVIAYARMLQVRLADAG